jgi:hypothetical protein
LVLAAAAALLAAAGPEAGRGRVRNGGSTQRNSSVVLYADSIIAALQATRQVQLCVLSSAIQDPRTGHYHYSYRVRNLVTSPNAVQRFGIAPLCVEPLTVDAPDHWSAFWGYQDVDTAVVWAETDSGVPPPGWRGSTNNIYPSGYEIQPGQALVFSFDTPVAPMLNAANFYAQGFDTLRGELSLDDSSGPQTLFQEGAIGSVIAPGNSTGVESGGRDETPGPSRSTPNPAAGTVAIGFDLPAGGRLTLGVYDAAGRRVRQVANLVLPRGLHSVTWDTRDDHGRRVRPGVYLYRLSLDGRQLAGRRIVIVP